MFNDCNATASQPSRMLTKYSVMRKFGITAQTCTLAASPTKVELKLCGAISTERACAIAATSINAVMPPIAQTSGLNTSAALIANA